MFTCDFTLFTWDSAVDSSVKQVFAFKTRNSCIASFTNWIKKRNVLEIMVWNKMQCKRLLSILFWCPVLLYIRWSYVVIVFYWALYVTLTNKELELVAVHAGLVLVAWYCIIIRCIIKHKVHARKRLVTCEIVKGVLSHKITKKIHIHLYFIATH